MGTDGAPPAFLVPWLRRLRRVLSISYDSHLSFDYREPHVDTRYSRYSTDRDRVDVSLSASRCWLRVRLCFMSDTEILKAQRRAQCVREQADANAEAVEDPPSSVPDMLRRVGEALLLTSVLAAVDYDAWLSALQDVALLKIPFDLDLKECLPCRFEIAGDALLHAGGGSPADDHWSALLCESLSDEFMRDLSRLKKLYDLPELKPTPLRLALGVTTASSDGGVGKVEYLQETIGLLKTLTRTSVNKPMSFSLHSVDLRLRSVGRTLRALEATIMLLTTCPVPIQALMLPPSGWKGDDCDRAAYLTKWDELMRTAAGLVNESVQVYSVHITEAHLHPDFGDALFGALAVTQSIQALSIEMLSTDEEIVRGRLECLGRTILKASSTSSIKTLSIWAPKITFQQVESMAAAIADSGEEEHNGQSFGRGLSRLKTLMVRLTQVDDHDEALDQLLGLLGSRLTGLHISAPNMSDETMKAIVRHCSRLRRLWIENASLKSMEMFVRGYEAGFPLESLALQAIRMAPHIFEEFLTVLGQHSAAASTLRSLRFGRNWAFQWPKSTFDVLRQTLVSNRVLARVQMLVFMSEYGTYRSFTDTLGRGLYMTQPLAIDRRCALLSVLKTFDALSSVDSNITSKIFAFAAGDAPRAVHVLSHNATS